MVEAVGSNEELLALANVELQIHTYKIRAGAGSAVAYLHTHEVGNVDEQPAARILELPADQLDGCWDWYSSPIAMLGRVLNFPVSITTLMLRRSCSISLLQ